jgi:hypothetical protein
MVGRAPERNEADPGSSGAAPIPGCSPRHYIACNGLMQPLRATA